MTGDFRRTAYGRKVTWQERQQEIQDLCFFVLFWFCFNNPLTQHITQVPQELPQSCSQAAFSVTDLSYNSARPPPRTKLPTHHPWRQTIPKPQQSNTSHFVFKARGIFYFGKNNFSRNPNRIFLHYPKGSQENVAEYWQHQRLKAKGGCVRKLKRNQLKKDCFWEQKNAPNARKFPYSLRNRPPCEWAPWFTGTVSVSSGCREMDRTPTICWEMLVCTV